MNNPKPCEHCNDVFFEEKIRSPYSLKNAIKYVRSKLLVGTIIESSFYLSDKVGESTPFDCINEEGPWDDFFVCYFECPKCKVIYQLSCETYHGSGGSWKPYNDFHLS